VPLVSTQFKMSYSRRLSIIVFSSVVGFAAAQTSEVSIETPKELPIVGHVLRPFHLEKRRVAAVRLSNSQRLESLVRAGNLYLSVQDVIALALENNLDIAVQRYATPLAREVMRRTQGGAPLRSIGQPIAPGPSSVSTAGVNVQSVGLPESGSGVTSGGGVVFSIGAQPPVLDPSLFAYASYTHATTPLTNQILGEVPVQINNSRLYEFGYSQSFLTGTSTQLLYYSFRNQVNSPAYVLDPYTQGFIDLQITQNLLQGFGLAVNNRFIRVAKNNMKVSDLQLKYQVITTVSAILNLYWDLVSFNQNVRIQEQALATAQKLYEDNQNQVRLGTLPAIEVTRAAAEVSTDKENVLIAQTNVAQQETVLKNALSRNGVESAWLDDVHIIPLDHIVVPDKEDLKANSELVRQALESRPELEQIRINTESSKINLAGTKNALLPTLQAFFELTNNGLTGTINPASAQFGELPIPAFVGGYGNLAGQIFQRNYPNYSASLSLNIPFRNRAAQADYVADQLNVRQNELQLQKATNQVRVDVQNAVIQLRVARARYESVVATRVLAQQTLEAEQNRFRFGESTIASVVQAQRDLNGDQNAEIQAMANYTHARIAFDEAVGQTLDVNGVSMEEARAGKVARSSLLPEGAPK
jgi:outer membrane protein